MTRVILMKALEYVIISEDCWMVQYSSQSTGSEGGPKNPLKGTSMKFLVPAFDAQSWGRMLGVKV